MGQGLKYMVSIYVGIFVIVWVFAFSNGDSGELSVATAEFNEKTKSAELAEAKHQPFNQVRFESGDQPLFAKPRSDDHSTHQALNIVKFDNDVHQAFNVVGFKKKD